MGKPENATTKIKTMWMPIRKETVMNVLLAGAELWQTTQQHLISGTLVDGQSSLGIFCFSINNINKQQH